MMRALTCLSLLLIAAPAAASSPAAWAQMDRQVDRACRTAAGLQRARVQADKASFSDTVPVELRIVEGYNRGGVVDVKLCAFNRRTGRVAITDGVGRLGVNRR
jgi:hypothetical protein